MVVVRAGAASDSLRHRRHGEDPVTSGKYQYPQDYSVSMNEAGQTVDTLARRVVGPSHPRAHILLP
jgi:hypothetical protein